MQNLAEQFHAVTSQSLFKEAKQYIPGGVNSPVRAYKAVGGTPPFIASGKGAHIIDVEGRSYIDYVGSWGPLILGHSHPEVLKAVIATAERGLSFGAPCALEVELAQMICELVPSVDKVRMVNSGTEATMSAIRLARGATGRDKIIKFEGCYHGHSDSLLVKAGSGALTFGAPSSPGVPQAATADTLVARYNDLDSVEALFVEHGKNIATIILEPIAGNMNMILPEPGFLQGLRDLCDRYGSLLIFDEVMTGFRVGPFGVQSLYDIVPDLTTFGKVIGGGMPVGAFGGRAEIMDQLSPEGAVYQAGTLSGNPVAMAAGIATLKQLQQPLCYQALEVATQYLIQGLLERAERCNVPLRANYCCGMFGLFFTKEEKVIRYEQVMQCDQSRFRQFFHGMLNNGVYMAPSAYEAGFVSLAHDMTALNDTLAVAERVFSE